MFFRYQLMTCVGVHVMYLSNDDGSTHLKVKITSLRFPVLQANGLAVTQLEGEQLA